MKVKYFYVSVELLKHLLAHGNVIPETKVVSDGWPSDARVINASVPYAGTVLLVIESDTFDEAPAPPLLSTSFEAQR